MRFAIGKEKEKLRFFGITLYIIKIVILNSLGDNISLLFRFMPFSKHFYICYFT
jgi:hypothetical protein